MPLLRIATGGWISGYDDRIRIATGGWMGGCNAPFKDCCGWMDGWMGGCNARCKDFLWMDGRVYVMAVLRIAI